MYCKGLLLLICVLACRTGDIIVRGQIPSVVIVSSGTGTVYVSGVTKDVMVNLSGIGNAVIDAASGEYFLLGPAIHGIHMACM